MEMPKCCLWYEDGKEGRCPFLDDGDCCRGQSDEANEAAETWDELRKGCPIKGVLPEEHGDLIDADAVYERAGQKKGEADPLALAREFWSAPVIIVAERKDDGNI